MAQLSYNTVFYDQLILRIRKFMIRFNNNEFSSYQELATEYNEIIKDINNYSGTQIAKYDPYIKGEPATSEKFNKFMNDVAKDLNIIAKQIDYQSAQVVSLYNLFNTELDKEAGFLTRINSKISILQMYSNSPGNDLYYVGDSFDNFDFVDVRKVKSNNIPNISGGSLKLGIRNSIQWVPSVIEIDQTYSNGFIGNNHAVYNSPNADGNTEYYFEKNDKVGYIPNVIDYNPLTCFDYEAINISKDLRSTRGAKDFEFFYSKETVVNNKTEVSYVSWADHQENTPLRLGIIISSARPQKMNSLKIIPNLGTGSNLIPEVKVVQVTAVDADTGNTIVLNNSGFYIGSTLVPQTIETRKNYFYQSATIDFPDINTSKITIHFEQSNSQNVNVKHLYWKPINVSSKDNPFYGSNRFNPDILSSQSYDSITYNFGTIVPSIRTPQMFKGKNFPSNKQILISANKNNSKLTTYLIKFDRNGTSYFLNGTSDTSDVNAASPRLSSQADAQTAINAFKTSTTYLSNPSQFSNLSAYQYEQTITTPFSYNLNLTSVYEQELYPAKKWSISLKSIEAYYNVYQNSASVVSKSFEFPYNIKNLSLSSELISASQQNSSSGIKYYVSVDDGNSWIQISPIENPFSGVPEILSFNENVFGSLQIPGVSYFNYPQVPKEIKKVRVKIDISKSSNANDTPVIYSYKLCAKVEQI